MRILMCKTWIFMNPKALGISFSSSLIYACLQPADVPLAPSMAEVFLLADDPSGVRVYWTGVLADRASEVTEKPWFIITTVTIVCLLTLYCVDSSCFYNHIKRFPRPMTTSFRPYLDGITTRVTVTHVADEPNLMTFRPKKYFR